MEPLLSTQAMVRHRRLLSLLVLAALGAHLLIVGGLDLRVPAGAPAAAAAAAVQVRVVQTPPAEPTLATPLPALPPTASEAVPVQRAPRQGRATPVPLAPAVVVVAPAFPAAVAATPVVDTTTLPTAPPDATPLHATQLPPAVSLRYVLTRGALRGTGELAWKPEADRYTLTLSGQVAGLPVLTQVSSGGFDAAGLAPLRFTDQRVRRGTKAANFQRDVGKITFSGPSTEFALREGTQDRLSWMVQLGAIVAADPRLQTAGARIALFVVGANGDASEWVFDGTGAETVSTGEGSVTALKFVREPREPYDTQVQVWLAATQHFLPVRATQKSGPDDVGFELRLQAGGTPP